jgi:bis(5'-nucleosidyl)-tetraphosphatase
MALSERSAGLIVYRVAANGGAQEFLLLDYGRYWDYPKGHVEAGEDDRTAALRELREETAIAAIELLDGFAHEMTYFFRSRRGLVRKTVVFFLGRVAPDAAVTLSAEHVDHAWLTYEAARDRVTYASAKAVIQAAQAHLIGLS